MITVKSKNILKSSLFIKTLELIKSIKFNKDEVDFNKADYVLIKLKLKAVKDS
jgi:hypothetical protein